MESSEKKISFSFSKIVKKPALINKPEEKKVELIDCLEGQNIKIKDAVEIEDKPLVIPLNDNKKNLLDRIKEFRKKEKPNTDINVSEDIRHDSELTIDELAARELLRDAQNRQTNTAVSKGTFTLPMKDSQEDLSFEGEAEPTLDDYEKIPISDYGLALLRGMGWKEGSGIGKNPTKIAPVSAPELRPKGLGLGATKMLKGEIPKQANSGKDEKSLTLKKGAFAKLIAGSHKGQYCEVQGFDDEAARVIVKTALKGEILTVNEFFIMLVTKEEYGKYSKVLNNAKYEEYKERELNRQKSQESESRFNKKSSNADIDTNTPRDQHRKNDSESSDSSYESQNEKSNKHKRKDKRRHKDKSRSPPSYRYRNKNGKKYSGRHSSSSSDSEYEEKRRERNRSSRYSREKSSKR